MEMAEQFLAATDIHMLLKSRLLRLPMETQAAYPFRFTYIATAGLNFSLAS